MWPDKRGAAFCPSPDWAAQSPSEALDSRGGGSMLTFAEHPVQYCEHTLMSLMCVDSPKHFIRIVVILIITY